MSDSWLPADDSRLDTGNIHLGKDEYDQIMAEDEAARRKQCEAVADGLDVGPAVVMAVLIKAHEDGIIEWTSWQED